MLCRVPGYVVGHDLDYRRMEGSPDEAVISWGHSQDARHPQVCECHTQIFQAWPHAEGAFYAINLGFTIAFVAAQKQPIRRTVEPVAGEVEVRRKVTG